MSTDAADIHQSIVAATTPQSVELHDWPVHRSLTEAALTTDRRLTRGLA